MNHAFRGGYNPTFSVIRLPLAFMVVVLHLGLPGQHESYFLGFPHTIEESAHMLEVLFSRNIVHWAVPTFYVISGYLFFQNITEFKRSIYIKKIKSRTKTILVPYLLWNILYVIFLLSMKLLGVIAHGNNTQGITLFLHEHCGLDKILWNHQQFIQTNMLGCHVVSYFPINAPLWFLRDLYICMLLSPIVYIVCKKLGKWGIAVLFVIYNLQWQPPVPGFSITAIFFFSLGAWFGIKRINLTQFSKRYKIAAYLMALMLTPLLFIQNISNDIFPLYKFIGVFVLLALFSRISQSEKFHLLEKMSEFSMFVFVGQYFFLDICKGMLTRVLSMNGEFLDETLLYVFTPIFVIIVMGLTHLVARKVCPKTLAFSLGNRTT